MTQFPHLGEYLTAIRNASIIGGRTDPRLYQMRGINPPGASEIIPSAGGFLLPETWSRSIMERASLTSAVLSRVTSVPVTKGNSVTVNQFNEQSRANGSRFGGAWAQFIDEDDDLIPSLPTYSRAKLTLGKLAAFCFFSEELMQDSAALDIFASAAFAKEIGFVLVDAIINQSGAGKPQGILNSGCFIQVPKEQNQAAGTLTGQNLVDAWSRCWIGSRPSSVWLMHPDAQNAAVTATISAGTGGSQLSIYKCAETEDQPDMLLGRPVIPCEQCQPLGQPGDAIIADLSRVLLAAKEIAGAVSMEVAYLSGQQTENTWISGQGGFRLILRCQAQCLDNCPITPFSGTNTTSPFVAIAARD